MHQDAMGVLRRNIEAFSNGDMDGVASTLAEHGRYEEYATRRVATGRDQEMELNRGWRAAFPDARGTINNVFGTGDQAVAEVVWEGTHRGALETPDGPILPTEKRVSVPAVLIVKVRDGMIEESHHYFDMQSLIQQIR